MIDLLTAMVNSVGGLVTVLLGTQPQLAERAVYAWKRGTLMDPLRSPWVLRRLGQVWLWLALALVGTAVGLLIASRAAWQEAERQDWIASVDDTGLERTADNAR